MGGLYNRFGNEVLSDNTQVNYCEQCEQCIHWGKSGTPWDNADKKSNCEEFPYPESMKPIEVINNRMPCPRRKVNG